MPAPLLSIALFALQSGGANYHNPAAVEQTLRDAVAKHGNRAKIDSIGKTLAGDSIWCVTLTEGDERQKSAVLVLGGANGAHQVGVEAALANVTQILERADADPAVAQLLKEHCFYMIPLLNPEGAKFMFANPKMEHPANARPVDDDRDRRTDEDPPDDANGDGWITMMRFPDPKGEYVIDAKDPRIVRKADSAKGERGTHKLVAEGVDDDHDGKWNEDGVGGVRIDRNFPYQWKEFDRATGSSAVSEPESRALADFLLNHTNIAAVVVYGLHDNVRKAPKTEAGPADDATDTPAPAAGGGGRGGRGGRAGGGGGAAPTSILKDDGSLYERAAKIYKEKVGAEGDVEDVPSDGAIHQWAYFHRGLPAFAVRVWTPPSGTRAASGPASKPSGEGESQSRPTRGPRRETTTDKPEDEDRSKSERARLEWNDKTLNGDGFVQWKAAENPELKAIGAEIGGWKPGVLFNPPAGDLAEITKKHTDFLLAIAPECYPKVVIASAKFTENKNGLATFKASIRNDGKAPALSAMARRAGTTRPVRVRLTVDGGQIVAGRPQYLVSNLDPQDAPVEWTWVVQGKPGSKVKLEVNYPFGPDSVFTGEIQ
ncbi:MAG: hypothetical protein HY286_12675 [Planctomycetes bacterium]|nr:hypothetical protein [Planctomycetota bacterium]